MKKSAPAPRRPSRHRSRRPRPHRPRRHPPPPVATSRTAALGASATAGRGVPTTVGRGGRQRRAARVVPEESAKGPTAAPESARKEETERGGPTTRSAAPTATSAPTKSDVPATGVAPSPDWDVVPVFYGTDRKRQDQAKRIGVRLGPRAQARGWPGAGYGSQGAPGAERRAAVGDQDPLHSIVLYQQDEDPKRHFTIQEIKALSSERASGAHPRAVACFAKLPGPGPRVFIHGYNNGFDYALFRTAQIAYDLKYDGAPFLYSWPSGARHRGLSLRSRERTAGGAVSPAVPADGAEGNRREERQHYRPQHGQPAPCCRFCAISIATVPKWRASVRSSSPRPTSIATAFSSWPVRSAA